MQRLEVSGAVRPIYGSLGVKRLIAKIILTCTVSKTSKFVMEKPYLFLGYILETAKTPKAPPALITYRNFGDETILLTDVTSLLCVHFMRFVQRSESHDHGE